MKSISLSPVKTFLVLALLILSLLAVRSALGQALSAETEVLSAYPEPERPTTAVVDVAYPDPSVTVPAPWPTLPPPTPSPTPVVMFYKERAIAYVAETYDLEPDVLAVGEGHDFVLPLTGKQFWRAVVMYPAAGQVYDVAIDPEGEIVDAAALRREESRAYAAKYGKLDPQLYDLLDTKDDQELVRVGIWLTDIDHAAIQESITSRYPQADLIDGRPGRDTDLGLYSQIEQEIRDANIQAYAINQQAVCEWIEERGYRVTSASRAAPLIFTELPKQLILSLTLREDVDTIYLELELEPQMESAVVSERVDVV